MTVKTAAPRTHGTCVDFRPDGANEQMGIPKVRLFPAKLAVQGQRSTRAVDQTRGRRQLGVKSAVEALQKGLSWVAIMVDEGVVEVCEGIRRGRSRGSRFLIFRAGQHWT